MKNIIPLIITLALSLPLFAQAADEPDTTQSFFEGLSVRPFAYVEAHNTSEIEGDGGGIGIAYNITDNLGLETESFIADYKLDGPGIDRQSLNLTFRAPVGESFAFVPFGGVSRDFGVDEWAFHVGLRAEVRLSSTVNVLKDTWLSADARWLNQDSDDWAILTGGVSYKF